MYYFPSTWRRLFAHFLDQAYVLILQAPVLITMIINFFQTETLRMHWSHVVYLILVRLLYEILSLYFYSTTLGKHQWGLRVITRDSGSADKSVSLEQAILRSLVSRLNFFFGWAIYVLAFFKYNRTHLADWVANTQVVSTIERKNLPKKHWVVASIFIFLTAGESLKSASMTLNAIKWQKPYLVFDSQSLQDVLDQIDFSGEFEEDED
jgi:uncharacterized RDD family membrane protein YckC